MTLTCVRCQGEFEESTFRGYCPGCVEHFRGQADRSRRARHPVPGVHLNIRMLEAGDCPLAAVNPATGQSVCGLCGSDELEPGYGFAGGFGLGVYTCCSDCHAVLDFSPDEE
jgi:hypothetical protein